MTEDEIEEYSNLIYSITKYFEAYKYKEDLYQEGVVALLKAKQKYNPSYDVKFSTFAFKYIYGEMSKTVREDKNIKISRNVIRLKKSIEKASDYLRQRLFREPTLNELADFLDIDEYEISNAIKISGNTKSMDEIISSDNKELTYYDILSKEDLDINTLVALKEELQTLTPKQKEIIKERYNMDLTQQEVARNLGLTQVKVSREEQKIKQKLKKNLIA